MTVLQVKAFDEARFKAELMAYLGVVDASKLSVSVSSSQPLAVVEAQQVLV